MMFTRLRAVLMFAVLATGFARAAFAVECEALNYQGQSYTACTVDPKTEDIRLFLNSDSGKPLGSFTAVNKALTAKGERLAFGMNGGMYHKDRSPVGGYWEQGRDVTPMNSNKGPGNFHMLPNGVFLIWQEDGYRGTHILTSENYRDKMAPDVVRYATQSGPMLVIDGALHPRFRKGSDSLRIRNGVGQRADGTLVFVMSDAPVNFYSFANLFKDHYKTPNALYLDGTISRLYAPGLGRNDFGAAMGPIVGVVEKRVDAEDRAE